VLSAPLRRIAPIPHAEKESVEERV
jgi:hypothetical protein